MLERVLGLLTWMVWGLESTWGRVTVGLHAFAIVAYNLGLQRRNWLLAGVRPLGGDCKYVVAGEWRMVAMKEWHE